ncbi:TonB-dependent receptor [Ampullimonas aquatilis]|uniref:TonB-dependent receptor n=1 Tax=Ampullimonas aquatilis TaxID=1341549 RepID=UPI003C77A50E
MLYPRIGSTQSSQNNFPFKGKTIALAILAITQSYAISAKAADQVLPEITVISTTPLPGLGVSREQIPAPIQTRTGQQLDNSHATDLSQFINRELGSVFVNEIQGNGFQMDVNYRGFTASPLLGTPQGLSVYMDGVRLNQPFGDVVSWDLIPKSAIESITLMPGSNPLFGLNTLGGALSLQTKSGLTAPGTVLQATLGSHNRRNMELSHGGFNDKGLNWFVTGNWHADDGWRNDSPSKVRQLFGKLGWADARTSVALTMAYAKNNLQGNGLQDQQFLARDYSSVYTKPDITENRNFALTLNGQHEIRDGLVFSGNTYYRNLHTSTFNGDINEGSLDQSVYQPSAADRTALTNAGYTGFPTSGANAANTPFPFWRCIAQALQNDEPGEKCNGLITRASSSQKNYGASGQLAWQGELAGKRNLFTAGAAYDESRIRYSKLTELGYLNPDRSVTGVGAFADGVTGGDIDGEALDTQVNLKGKSSTWSLFASDTLALTEQWNLNAAARYNETSVHNTDQIHADGDPASLSGNHRFNRLNPAIGVTFVPSKSLTAYAGYNEGSRAPSAIELGCANPDQPCKLPNSMAGDPPLKQVVTKTFELGMRGNVNNQVRWNAGVFRADNYDDIQFVADNQAGFGYFKNFGKTRRQGLELGANTNMGNWLLGANYTYLDATYQSGETVNGSGNSSNSSAQDGNLGTEGTIQIRPGDRIPLIPRQILKLSAAYQFTPEFTLGTSMQAQSGVMARGNENGQHQPDGTYYLGQGKTAGFAIFNLDATWKATPQLTLFAQVNNILDKRYATAAQLGSTGFDANGNFVARAFPRLASGDYPVAQSTFYAPGAPRQFMIGLRYAFDKPVVR